MTHFIGLSRLVLTPLRRFKRDTGGTVSVELVIVMPLLLWALAATVVFYDGFRNRYHAQMAAQTVADIMSRETDLFTADYVEGLNDVFDFLADSRYPTRIRVSSVIWDSEHERNRLQWSYGTRGLSGLPTDTFELMQAGDYETLLAEFGDDDSFSFAGNAAQMPITDLPQRIPPVLPGEALLLVETFALWTPFTNVGVGQIRFTPVVVVRPRFAPWINFEGVDPIYPEDNYEITWTGGGGGNDSLPDPNDPDPTPTPTPTPTVTTFTFENGVTTGWSRSTITAGGPSGSFLGPFGLETYDTPLTLDVNLGTRTDTATITFDLIIMDKWKGWATNNDALPRGDALTIMIDGVPISLEAFVHDAKEAYGKARASLVYVNGATYRVNMIPTRTGDDFIGRGDKDQIWAVTITATNAPATFQLGFSAGLNNDISNESFGIDNFRVGATGDGSGVTAAPIPDPRSFTGLDPYTRFPQYAGCPDYTLPSPWLTMDVDNIDKRIEIERQARVGTDLRQCPNVPGLGYVSASPQFQYNFTRNGNRNDRLQITMDDDNNGYTCDTTLLVRDPNGQWWFNDDFDRWNAGLRFGNAPEGIYSVWIGSYNNDACTSVISFERQ